MNSEVERLFRAWGRGIVVGLYCGLSLLFAINAIYPLPNDVLQKYTNVYGLEAALGAVIGFRLIRGQKNKSDLWGFSPIWICLGLTFWAIAQFWWFKETVIDGVRAPYPGLPDIPFLLADLLFVVALMSLFAALRRRFISELPPWGFIVSIGTSLTVTLVLWLNRGSMDVRNVGADLFYLLLTEFATLLAFTLIQGVNSRLPAPVHRCLWYMVFAALLELLSTAAFVVTDRLPNKDVLKYQDGDWVDWLLLGGMAWWSLAILEYPVGRGLYFYSYGTLAQSIRSRRDAHLAASLAEECLGGEAESREMRFSADWTDWLFRCFPEGWMVAKYGDEVVGTSILVPLSEDLKDRFVSKQISEQQVFDVLRTGEALKWDWIYVAETAVRSTHKGRHIGYECVMQTAQYLSAKHAPMRMLCKPTTDAGIQVARQLRENLPDLKVEIV